MEASNIHHEYSNTSTGLLGGLSDLLSLPDYRQLIAYYQSGKFKKCIKRIKELEEQYPQHPELLRFKENIELKLSIKSMTSSIHRKETHERIKEFLKFNYLIILIAIFVLLISVFSYDYIKNNLFAGLTRDERVQLGVLVAQVEQLLNEGEPEAAAEKLERIREIDPEHEEIPDLTSQVYNLLLLKMDYKKAMGLLEEGREIEALNILMKIEQETPGLWDVRQQIALIQALPTP